MTSGPPDTEALAELAGQENARHARVRQAAVTARQRRAEVREAVQAAEDRVVELARAVAYGTAAEADVVAAIADRDELRRRVEVCDLVVHEIDADPAMRGRR